MFAFVAIVLAVLASDPLTGAPAITDAQEKLIVLMGDNDYKTREKATADLGKMDYDGLRAMYKAAKSGDPEVAHRAQRLLSQYYSVQNSKKEIPGIQGMYEMKSFKLKSGKTMEIQDSDANDYYTQAGGKSDTDAMDANNFKTREATGLLVHKLRNKGFTKEEVTEILDKITEEGNGNEMGNAGYKKFREMQGLPEYDPWGPGAMGMGVFRNMFRGLPRMPRAIN